MYSLATPARTDYPVLLHIWESSVSATHHFLKKEDIDFFKNAIREHALFDAVQLTCIKSDSGEILGFMGTSGDRLEMLFLHPDARGKGLGKMLLQHAVEKLQVRRIDVNEQNEQAVKFYEGFGFKTISRSPLDGMGKPYPILHLGLT